MLSVGLQPCKENLELAGQLNLKVGDSGFVIPSEIDGEASNGVGVFSAGAVGGLIPMSIAESIASAGETSRKRYALLKDNSGYESRRFYF